MSYLGQCDLRLTDRYTVSASGFNLFILHLNAKTYKMSSPVFQGSLNKQNPAVFTTVPREQGADSGGRKGEVVVDISRE